MLDNIIQVLSGESLTSTYYSKKRKNNLGHSVMVQMPTGTGKTYVMASVVKWFLDYHDQGEVWIVAHRRELVEQMQQTLDRFCLVYGEKEMVLKAKVRIRVLSIQWLTRHIDELETAGCTPGLIIVDEAHHAIAASYQDVFVRHQAAMKLGMTATPCRLAKKSFTGLFERLLVSPCTNDFIMRGYLSPYDYVVVGKSSTDQLVVDQLKGRGSDGDYAIKEMDEKLNIPQTIQRLYDSVKKYANGKKGIVYAIDILHAQAIAACYNALGLKSVALDSKTPAKKRQEMVEVFRRSEIDCLVNVNLFDEGFDCPDVEFIQMARPTLSLAKYLQMVGRGLRINKENKDKGEAWLADKALEEGVVSLPSGLMYQVLNEGNGKKPTAEDTVECHYEGRLIDGTVFDSSYKRGESATFPLNGVIAGWTEGVQLMSEGAKYRFFIPYQLAYGERGAGAAIPPFAALVFDVELIKVL